VPLGEQWIETKDEGESLDYRDGNDQLLVDAAGHSAVTVQDYAVAMIDELENPTHIRKRFTVGY
jgi:putative NADH-flavin reductase